MKSIPFVPFEFDCEALYQKAKIYIDKCCNLENEDPWIAFWMALSLEFLLRSALAAISPILIAEGSSNCDANLLAAAGFRYSTKHLRSLPIKRVIERLKHVNINFEDKLAKMAVTIIELRNDELHSGLNKFIDSQKQIIENYYKISVVLLKSLDKSIIEYYGETNAQLVEICIGQISSNLAKVVESRKGSCSSIYEMYSQTEKNQKIQLISKYVPDKPFKLINCPSCKNEVLVNGRVLRVEKETFLDNIIQQKVFCLPESLSCSCCGFTLNNIDEFNALSLAQPFSFVFEIDPVDYYNIDISSYLDSQVLIDCGKEYLYESGYMDE